MSLRESMIFGLCNPLLDVTAEVEVDFLKKFDLKENTAILGDETNDKIYEEMEKVHNHVDFSPGGATQNSMRVVSCLLKHPNVATFMGCVGKDRYAEIMMEKAKSVGLNVCYQFNTEQHTGRCAVMITGKNRTLVAHLNAANFFTIEHLNEPSHWSHIEKAVFHYVSGFFLTVCPDAIKKIAEFSHANDRVFSMNLSAPFISQFFGDKFKEVFPYVNYLFGNNDEAMAFSKYILGNDTTDIVSIAKQISTMPSIDKKKRTVIITQGSEPVIVAIDGIVQQFDVPKVPSEKIVDTNGAGDAFVGGFLSQFIKGEPLDVCIKCGVWIAEIVIQRHGCTWPEDAEFKK